MNEKFSMKELYDLTLKVTSPVEIENRKFEPGEVVARFDKIRIANFQEIVSRVSANGGYDNRAHVIWEDSKEIQVSFNQGVFSKTQLALLWNSKIVKGQKEEILITNHLSGVTDEKGSFLIPYKELKRIFVYKAETGERKRIINTEWLSDATRSFIDEPFCAIEVDYEYLYSGRVSTLTSGSRLTNQTFLLEAKTRIKDDETGQVCTAILRIPRFKLISELSMRLGEDAAPVAASFRGVGLPLGDRNNKKIMEMIFLDRDIDR